MQEGIGSLKTEYLIKLKCIEKYRVSLTAGKTYNARECGKGWYALIDDTNEEYAYPPTLFAIID